MYTLNQLFSFIYSIWAFPVFFVIVKKTSAGSFVIEFSFFNRGSTHAIAIHAMKCPLPFDLKNHLIHYYTALQITFYLLCNQWTATQWDFLIYVFLLWFGETMDFLYVFVEHFKWRDFKLCVLRSYISLGNNKNNAFETIKYSTFILWYGIKGTKENWNFERRGR